MQDKVTKNRRFIYDQMMQNDYDLEDFDSFSKQLDNEDARKELYDMLRSDDFNVGEYSDFAKKIYAPITEPENPFAQNNSVAPTPSEKPEEEKVQLSFTTPQRPQLQSLQVEQKEYPTIAEAAQKKMAEGVAQRQQLSDMTTSVQKSLNRRGAELEEAQKANTQSYIPQGTAGSIPAFDAGRMYDPEYRDYAAAKESLQKAQAIIDAAGKEAEDKEKGHTGLGGFFKGAQRGFDESVIDWNTWTAGLKDTSEGLAILKALDAAEEGTLTESQQALLDAKAIEIATSQAYSSSLGRGYKAGQVTAESIPFMIEFALNPIAGAGNTVAKKFARYALGRFGKEAAKKNVGKYVAGKALAQVATDALKAGAISATTGAGRTAADALQRMQGDIYYQPNEEGKVAFWKREGGEDATTAFKKAYANTTIENFSEMLGNYFAPIGKAAGIGVSKGLSKIGLEGVNQMLRDVKANDLAQLVSDFEKRAQWNGTIGEFGEEVAGNILNSIIVGDQTLDAQEGTGVFNKENLIDTYLGVALLGGIFSTAKTIDYPLYKYHSQKDIRNAQLDFDDAFGKDEEVAKINEALTSDDPRIAGEALRNIIGNENYTQEQQMSAAILAKTVQTYKGAKLFDEKMRNDPETPVEKVEVADSYDKGRNIATPQEKNDALNDLEAQEANIRQRYGLDPDADVNEFMGGDPIAFAMNEQDTELRSEVLDFVNAKAVYDGLTDGINERIATTIEESDRLIDSHVNKDDNLIHTATLKGVDEKSDRKVYIISGAFARNEDGTIDTTDLAEGASIIVKDATTGKSEFSDPRNLKDIAEAINPAEEKQRAAETITDEIATKEEAEIAGTLAFVPNDVYTIADENGAEHTATIVADTQDGNVQVIIDNAQEPMLMPKEKVQQMADAYNIGRANAKIAEKKAQSTIADSSLEETTPMVENVEPKKEVPVLKNGQPDFNAMDAEMFVNEYASRYGEESATKIARKNISSAREEIAKIDKKIDDITDPNQMQGLFDKKAEAEARLNRYVDILDRMGMSEDANETEADQKTKLRNEAGNKIVSLFPDGLPNVESFILADIATGNRVRWSDKETNGAVTSRGLGAELGLSGSNKERVKRLALISNDAMTPEEYAESLRERLDAAGIRYDETALRDDVINTYASVDTRKGAWEALENIANRANEQEQELMDWEDAQQRIAYEKAKNAVELPAVPDLATIEEEVPEVPVELGASFEENINEIENIINDERSTENADVPASVSAENGVADGDQTSIEMVQGAEADSTLGDSGSNEEQGSNESNVGEGVDDVSSADVFRAEESQVSSNDDGGSRGGSNQRKDRVLSKEVKVKLSENKDEFGKPFVLSSDGSIDFGFIEEDSDLTVAPIRLSLGENYVDDKGRNHGYGLLHIEAGHGAQIRNAGYETVEDFVKEVATNYTDIREGGIIADNQTYLLEVSDDHNNTLFIQLSRDGNYWNINSAGIFKKKYSRNKPKVHTRPAVGRSTNTDAPGVDNGQSMGVTAPAGNSPQTSESKDTTSEPQKQEIEQEKLQISAKEEMRRKPLRARAKMWEEKVGVKVNLIESYEDIPTDAAKRAVEEGQRVTGWIVNGEVYLYMPNIANRTEIDKTYLHEVIAHKGVKNLLGAEKHKEFCQRVWDEVMTDAEKDYYRNYPNVNSEAQAADEFIAHLSEDTDMNASVWQKIARIFRDILRKMGVDIHLTNADIEAMLRDSYKKLAEEKTNADVKAEGEENVRFSIRGKDALSNLHKASNTIRKWMENGSRGKSFEIELPESVNRQVRQAMGRDFESHNITANGIAHGFKNHGENGLKLTENSIPLRKEDMELIPYIMVAPDRVTKGTTDASGRESVRFYKTISDGYVAVVEKEYKNSVDDMETITMWAEMSPQATNAQSVIAPDTHARNAILSTDIAKIIQDAENAIEKEQNIQFRIEKPSLVGLHNISEEKLRKALKMGGLANPSVAVIDVDKNDHTDYGDYSLVLSKNMVDSRLGKNAGTWSGDAWTPTYPQVTKRMSKDKDISRYYKDISTLPEAIRGKVRLDFDSYMDGRSANALAYWYLFEKGEAPELVNVPARYPEDVVNTINEATNGSFSMFGLSAEDRARCVDAYVAYKYNGDRAAYDAEMDARKKRLENFAKNHDKSLIRKKAQEDLDAINEYGFDYDEVSRFIHDVEWDVRHRGEVDADATIKASMDYIADNNLETEYDAWRNSLDERYGIKEYIFDGYTNSGTPRYLPHTIENASKWMKKQGRQGAVATFPSFGTFVAVSIPKMTTLDSIRKRKNMLGKSEEEYDAFREKWENVYYELGKKLQPDANGFDDYGYWRLIEAVAQKNPKEYIKKQYNIELSEEDVDILNEMLDAIRKEYPARYFETKFERPINIREFVGAVVPENIPNDIEVELQKAGLNIYKYDPHKEGSRREATLDAVNSDNIRFRVADPAPTFYSNAERAAENVKQEKATPEQWLKMIEKNGGLKAGEDKWLGLSDWLKASDKKTLTKQEVLDFIKENQIQIEEVQYGDLEDSERFKSLQKEYRDLYYEKDRHGDLAFGEMIRRYGDDFDLAFAFAGDNLIIDDLYGTESAEAFLDANPINSTRLDYTTDGLKNKREIALTVPTIEDWRMDDEVHFGDAGNGRAIAWVRFGETTDADGNRVLVIDEIQSNRHQYARENGYRSSDAYREVMAYRAYLSEKYPNGWSPSVMTAEENETLSKLNSAMVSVRRSQTAAPEAPFEKNWAELAMKRMLRYATESGFDKVAWTTGEQQAERYDISKSVDNIKSEDNNVEETADGTLIVKNITIYAGGSVHNLFVDADGIVRGREYDGKKLSDIVGKPLAEKLMEQGDFELEGDGLRIGGEGMKAFYDQMLPSFMNKYGKKWGVKVGEVTMPSLEENNTMHSIDVTDAMRESVMQGQPMFRISDYDRQFAELQSEYDALDKNDEKALNEWREKKTNVVRDYLTHIKDRFGMRSDLIVFNGNDEEQMREAYKQLLASYEADGNINPPTYESFKKHSLKPDVVAIYRKDGDVIAFNAVADDLNDKMQFAETLFHENAHRVSYGLYSNNDFEAIWNGAKKYNNSITKTVEELYGDRTSEQKGKEYIAKAVGYLANEQKKSFMEFLRGNMPAEDLIKKLRSKSKIANLAVEETLNVIRDEYRDQESRRGDTRGLGEVGYGGSIQDPRVVLQGNERAEQERGGRNRERGGRPVLESFLNDVAQRGLREMVGEDAYNAFLMRAVRDLDEPTRRAIMENGMRNGLNFHEATEEYLASLAELDNVDEAYLSKVNALAKDMLKNVGIEVGDISNNELRYMLWRSHLQYDGVFSLAEDVVMRSKLGVGNYTQDANNDDIRFRVAPSTPSTGKARLMYDEAVRSHTKKNNVKKSENLWHHLREAYQDSMLSVQKLMEAVLAETGNTLRSSDDVYKAENQLSSKNKAEIEKWERDFMKPLQIEILDLTKKGAAYDDIVEYLLAKHGLERNVVIPMRDAEEIAERWEKKRLKGAEAAYKYEKKRIDGSYGGQRAALRKNLDTGAITQEQYEDAVSKLDKTHDKAIKRLERKYERLVEKIKDSRAEMYEKAWTRLRGEDYSGLTELTGEAKNFTEAAQKMVDMFEKKYSTDALWSKINAATKESLKKSYDSGLMSKETYDKVANMFQYYIPLRGWDNNVAADQYEYMANKGMKILPALKTAKGRTSRADDPIATLGSVGESSIIQGNRNLMKQKFLNFAQNNPTSLLTVDEQWYEQNADGTWRPSNPEIPTDATADEVDAIIKAHEAKMEALGDKATKKRQGLNINLHTTKWEEEEHAVNVKRNGKEYKIYVNGNPIAAQAINGFTNPNANKKDSWEWIEQRATAVKNFMARAFTSMNPAFVLSNLARDIIWAGTSVAIKENADYARQYSKNISKAMTSFQLPSLVSKWKKGTLDMNNPIEKYFHEFITNGGETGFTQLNTVDDYKRNMERFIKEAQGGVTTKAKKGWRWIWDNVEFLNRSAEDTTRFMVYLTSRQMGRPITESIANAKDITVNFNKKGRGTMGANVLGFAYIFFNATIQSLANFGKLIANHPKKTATALTLFGTSGMITPMVALAVQAMLSGDDDEPTYWDLPEWVRRNNIVIYVGGSGYVTIPLPHELRPFYGMGELAFSTLMGKEEPEVALQKAVEGFAGLMPFDFTGNAGNAIVNFTPTIAQPLVQLAVNKDYFGTPIYRKTAFNEQDPEWTKAYKSTNQLLVDATEFLNELTGGDEVKNGLIDLNPAVIEHLYEGYLGGMGKTINRAAKTFSMLWDEDARTWRNVPVASSFYQVSDERTSGSQVNREYFDAVDEADAVEHLYSGYQKRAKMGVEEYAEKLNELIESDAFKRYQKVNSYKKAIAKMNTVLKEADPTDREGIETRIMELKVDMLEELDAMDDK